ncbi:MAG: NAD(P)H-dependent oxidoreductase [Acidobacteria bacterium]|nr:NAD(P)H-dependent oxidoreductase [Acidobacteriota bacterium]
MPRLGIVIASVREGRIGLPVAQWFIERARRHGRFDVEVVDLKEIDLPLFAERHHPRLQKYESETQKAWSTLVSGLDAFVFVTPEYNYGLSPALLNALDYLFVEWHYKPAAFVSYGGISGGIRGVQMAKQTLTTLKMVPIVEAVAIPFVAQAVDREAGVFKPTEQHEQSATALLDELLRWTEALAVLRQK